MAADAYTRHYTNISPAHFTWLGEQSDGKTWREFMVVEAYRSREESNSRWH